MTFRVILDYLNIVTEYLENIIFSIINFIFENKFVFALFISGVLLSVILILFDFLFNVNDLVFNDFRKSNNTSYKNYRMIYKLIKKNKKHNQKQLDMDNVYQRSKSLAEYKHRLKMEELNKFSDNYDKVQKLYNQKQQDKNKYNRNYLNKKNLNIEYDEKLAP